MEYSSGFYYNKESFKNGPYKKFVDYLLKNSKSNKDDLEKILYTGKLGDYSVTCPIHMRDNADREQARRAGIAYLLSTHPETFEEIKNLNVNLYHGTNSLALPSILKYGMQYYDKLKENGINVRTGEEWSRGTGRDFISLTDDIEIANYYALTGGPKDTKNSFGVILGFSAEDLKKKKTCIITSDIREFGIVDTIEPELIKIIGVPEDKVRFVKKLLKNSSISVVPMKIEDKFFGAIDIFGGDFEFYEEGIRNNNTSTIRDFNISDFAKLAFQRTRIGIETIKNKILALTSKIKGDRGDKDSGFTRD